MIISADFEQNPESLICSTSPEIYASFSPQAQALLDGLILVAYDPELASAHPEPSIENKPVPIHFEAALELNLNSPYWSESLGLSA